MPQQRGDHHADKEGRAPRHALDEQEAKSGMPMDLQRCLHKLTEKTNFHITNFQASNSEINKLPKNLMISMNVCKKMRIRIPKNMLMSIEDSGGLLK